MKKISPEIELNDVNIEKKISKSIWTKLFWGKIEDTGCFSMYSFSPVTEILNFL